MTDDKNGNPAADMFAKLAAQQQTRKTLMAFADDFFEGADSHARIFACMEIAMGQVSRVFQGAAARGVLTRDELILYSLGTCAAAAIAACARRELTGGAKMTPQSLAEEMKALVRAAKPQEAKAADVPDPDDPT